MKLYIFYGNFVLLNISDEDIFEKWQNSAMSNVELKLEGKSVNTFSF